MFSTDSLRRTPGHCHNRRHLCGLLSPVGGTAVFRGDLATQALRFLPRPTHLPPRSYYLPMCLMPRRLLDLQHLICRILLSPKYVNLRTDYAVDFAAFVAVIFLLLAIEARRLPLELPGCLRHYPPNRILHLLRSFIRSQLNQILLQME